MPKEMQNVNAKIDEYARGIVSGGTLFEELGYYYIGPIDGHDLDNLVPILENLRDTPSNKPVLLHIKTEKGMGYPPAMKASDKMHGVAKFDLATGKQMKGKGAKAPSLTSVFANELIKVATDDRSVVGITAAMPGGTGMDLFGASGFRQGVQHRHHHQQQQQQRYQHDCCRRHHHHYHHHRHRRHRHQQAGASLAVLTTWVSPSSTPSPSRRPWRRRA